jgi:SAM-dependent methyltransferase
MFVNCYLTRRPPSGEVARGAAGGHIRSTASLQAPHAGLPLTQSDATRLPLRTAITALAYSSCTTADWNDLGGGFAEACRILTPGGRYVCVAAHPCFVGRDGERRGFDLDLDQAFAATARGRARSTAS